MVGVTYGIYMTQKDNIFTVRFDEIDFLLTKKESNESYLLDYYQINTININSNGQMQLSIIHFHMFWNT